MLPASAVVLALFIAISMIAGSVALGESKVNMGLYDEKRGVLSVSSVIKSAAPAVVNISVAQRIPGADNPLFRDPFFRRYFGVPDQVPDRESMSAGSGVIVDADKGYVLTNHHVIDNANRILVKLKDGRQFKAKLIGSDAATDIGLIQIDAKRLAELPFGDSDQLQVGDFVVAIGNPFGLGQTVTSGIVSALGRSGIAREKFEDFIQTDAPINPGNSGGALVNTKGELIGINTAIIAPGGGNVGIGFAVPTKMARAVMDQLIRHGEVRRGRIGISIQSVTPDIAQALGLPTPRGAVVSKVEKNSPAEAAGLLPGDTIIKVDGQGIDDSNDLRNLVGLRERGDRIAITIVRKGTERQLSVTVGEARSAALQAGDGLPQLSGARIGSIPADHPRHGEVDGVMVRDLATGSPAWRLGLRQGDIILSVNQRAVQTISDFERAAKEADGVLALNILRGDTEIFVIAQ
ncbi:MAG: DegQ family serine endoprotease [Rhizobiales bacterium]|nr:DegQ family serine endoprotease [Hyphomicrobiales bacterium]